MLYSNFVAGEFGQCRMDLCRFFSFKQIRLYMRHYCYCRVLPSKLTFRIRPNLCVEYFCIRCIIISWILCLLSTWWFISLWLVWIEEGWSLSSIKIAYSAEISRCMWKCRCAHKGIIRRRRRRRRRRWLSLN